MGRPISGRPGVAIAAVVLAVVALGGSAFAGGRFDAQNAAKVDGFSAVGAGASLSTAAGKLVATRPSGPGKGTFAPKFLGSVVQGKGSLKSFAAQMGNNAERPLFVVPGVVNVKITCRASTGQFEVHFDNEQLDGEIVYHNLSGSSGGGTAAMFAGNSSTVFVDTFTDMFVTIRAGFGPSAHVTTAVLDLLQPNGTTCWVTGRALIT